MSGERFDVSARIKDINKKLLFTHCYRYALNLVVKDFCNVVKCLKGTFDTAREICKLVTKSPLRDTHLKKTRIKRGNEDFNFYSFFPTL